MGDMDPVVAAAFIASVPATLAAVASWKTNRRIKTNHGKSIGQHVEQIGADLAAHTKQDAAQFSEIREWLGMPRHEDLV